ncbi:predicted protein, partial [Naegleria gruberi]
FNLEYTLDELKDKISQLRIQHLEKLLKVNEYNLSEQEKTIRTLCEKNESLENQLKEASRIPNVKQVVRIPKASQTIHSLKKELNRIEKQISEMSTCGKNIEFKELNQLLEERNRIEDLIFENYSGKLDEFDNDKRELINEIERVENSLREHEVNFECFQNVNKLKLKKKDLFKSLAEIKDKIEDIEYAKDTLIFEIKTQKRNKIGKVEEIERLEKKLSDMIQELSNMHERKSEIQNDLMELIPKFPEIIIEMEQPLAIDGVVISSSMTPKEKFRVFALQNSILLLNTQFSNYTNIQTLHTGLSVVYKASKSNSQ